MGKLVDSFRDDIRAALKAGGPFLIVGPHGSGKMAMAEEAARTLGLAVKHYSLAVLTVWDLSRLSARFARPTVGFIDICHRTPPEVLLEVSRRIPSFHGQVIIFATSVDDVPEEILFLCKTVLQVSLDLEQERLRDWAARVEREAARV